MSISMAMASVYAAINEGKAIDKVFKAASNKGVTFNNGMMVIKHERAKALFTPVVDEIVAHTKKLLEHPKLKMSYILMVGGFSECLILQTEIRKHFHENGCKVLVPSEAQLAIIKGAVLYGHNPGEIGTRIARYSYGVCIKTDWDASIHDKRYKEVKDGEENCDNIFSCFVRKDEEVATGSTVKRGYSTGLEDQKNILFPLYNYNAVPNDPVQYTTAEGMNKIGQITCNMPGTGVGRAVDITMTFGGTEIQVEAVNRTTGEKVSTVINFLAH